MVAALLALILGAMLLAGDGPDVAQGSDEPAMTAEEAAEEIAALRSGPETPPATGADAGADDGPAESAAALEETPVPAIAATAETAPDSVVRAALAVAEEPAEPAAAPSASTARTGVITGRRVNVRSGPSTAYGVIDQVIESQTVEILGYEANGWARILVNGQEGYMSGGFIEERPQG